MTKRPATNLYTDLLNDSGSWIYDYPQALPDASKAFDTLKNLQDFSYNSSQIRSRLGSPDINYYLAPDRANVLRPFVFQPGAKVLDLNCEGGVITRWLGEASLEVTAVSILKRHCLLTATRCQDLNNVSVYRALLSDSMFQPNSYDYIILQDLGVYLTAAASYQNQPLPECFSNLIKRIAQLLKPAGLVFITSENPLGLNNFAGGWDAVGMTPFESLTGFPHGRGFPVTQNLVQQAIEENLLKNNQIYCPFPDFIHAQTIISDDFCHQYPDINGLVSYMSINNRNSIRHHLFSESLCWPQLAKNDLILPLSPSFLFVATNNGTLPSRNFDFIHYSHYLRHEKFCAITKKVTGQQKVVRLNQEDQPLLKLDEEFLHWNPETEGYHQGELLAQNLHFLASNTKNLEPFYQRINEYCDYIESQLAEKNEVSFLMDASFSNIIIGDKGQFTPFDLEWGIKLKNSSLTTSFILFRSLIYWIPIARPFLSHFRNQQVTTAKDLIFSIFAKLDMMLTPKDFNSFLEKEAMFQAHVHFLGLKEKEVRLQELQSLVKIDLPETNQMLQEKLRKLKRLQENYAQLLKNYAQIQEDHKALSKNDQKLQADNIQALKTCDLLKEDNVKLAHARIELEQNLGMWQGRYQEQGKTITTRETRIYDLENHAKHVEHQLDLTKTALNESQFKLEKITKDYHHIVNSRKWQLVLKITRLLKATLQVFGTRSKR